MHNKIIFVYIYIDYYYFFLFLLGRIQIHEDKEYLEGNYASRISLRNYSMTTILLTLIKLCRSLKRKPVNCTILQVYNLL